MQYHRADNGPRSKCDQVVFEAIAKACEIIVTSRCPSLDSAAAASSTTSRFNLQLPELAGVRSILQTTKSGGGALHVPLRLDVFYPHKDGGGDRRELLERWCLEYSVCGMERFLSREGTVTPQDPIAQLRLVCKRIVLWLRTLCCNTCLLPSQAFSQSTATALGFSLYMVSDAGDDVTELMKSQGFQRKIQPSSVVTPYGELEWKVYFAPAHTVERLLPQPRTASVSFRHASAAIPIHQHQYPANDSNNTINLSSSQEFQRRTAAWDHAKQMIPQSAPEYGGMANYPPSRFGTTYDPSHMNNKQQQQAVVRQDYQQRQEQQHRQHHHHPALLQRRHTVLGGGPPESTMSSPSRSPVPSQPVAGANPPERVLSGLSLMMMMNDEGKDQQNEKRRAALHQMPPHLVEQATKDATTEMTAKQGEYGYAYNNHIPWQAIHPSQTKPTSFDRSPSDVSETPTRPISASPHHSPWLAPALASTPPGEAFLGGAASPPFLMPPRNLMCTPPFKPRPVTFQPHEMIPPPPPPDHKPTATAGGDDDDKFDYESVVPPLTSLDLLHSSPFQTQHHHPHAHGSMLASFSLGATSLLPSDFRLGAGSANSALFSTALSLQQDDYLSEDMPFAVDVVTSKTTTAHHHRNADLQESASVASFAHQLKATNRLQLFESTAQLKTPTNDLVESLADQLAEFRTFGDSLHVTAASSDPTASASSSTPISTRS